MKAFTTMLSRVLFFISVHIVTTAAVECFYKGEPIPGTNLVELESMHCEHGCCGTLDEQECCKQLNWWMIFAFILTGFFLIFVIVTAVYLIVKKKNKKKERVGNSESTPGNEYQPSTVDLSVFRADNFRVSDPPAYSMYQMGRNTATPSELAVNHQHPAPVRYQEQTRNEASWRNSDLSHLDKYLERSTTKDTLDRVELSALNASHNHRENAVPAKLAAEYEDLRVSMDPDLTAECTYLGHTSEQPEDHPVVEPTDSSRFQYMTQSDNS